MSPILKATFAALAVAPHAWGHTWIEQIRNINDKGDYVGQYGYPRGMVSKTDPGFNGFSMNWELPAGQQKLFIDETTPLCHTAQRKQVQSSDKYPRLQATPGGYIAMRYQENGHVTLPQNQLGKPKKAGTVFVYGTTEPQEDEKLVNVLQWTKDGQGGNKKGILVTMNDYDDGRCYEMKADASTVREERMKDFPNFAMGQVVDGQPGNYPLACETNVQLPNTAPLGKPYTFYWVWQWNTAPGIDPGLPKGKDEYYSTCIDVDVASPEVAMATVADKKYAVGQQDAMSKAVPDFNQRTALMTDVKQGEVGPVFSNKPSGSPSDTPVPSAPSVSSGAPFLNSTTPLLPTKIPTLTPYPSAGPTSRPLNGIVTITDIVMVTVTATPSAAVVPRAAATPAVYSARYKHGAKFRGKFS